MRALKSSTTISLIGFPPSKRKIQLSVDDGLNNSDIADISGPLLLSAEVIFSDPLCLSEFVLAGLFRRLRKSEYIAISAFRCFFVVCPK